MGNDEKIITTQRVLTGLVATIAGFFALLWALNYVLKEPNQKPTNARKTETFDDFVQQNPDGTYELKPARQKQRERIPKRMREEAEQYVLLALKDGLYECLTCPNGTFYLLKGEVAKVGTTVRGEDGRYPKAYYDRNRLRYQTEYRGDKLTAEIREFLRLVNYPLLQENLDRPARPQGGVERYRLARPPMNPVDR